MELSSLEKDYFKELFKIADADKDGKIGTKDAPPFFQKALIEPSYLSKVLFIKINIDIYIDIKKRFGHYQIRIIRVI